MLSSGVKVSAAEKIYSINSTFEINKVKIEIANIKNFYVPNMNDPVYLLPKKTYIDKYQFNGKIFETPIDLIWPFTKIELSITNLGDKPLFFYNDTDISSQNPRKWNFNSYIMSENLRPQPAQYIKQFFQPTKMDTIYFGLQPNQTIEVHAYYIFSLQSKSFQLIMPSFHEGNDTFSVTVPVILPDKFNEIHRVILFKKIIDA